MEPNPSDAPLEAKEDARCNPPACITVTSYRCRLCDVDGISAKAIIDGLVHNGVLKDDGPRYVKKISYEQVKVKNTSEEKTVVEIKWEHQ
jgi:Holliday junction resolvase RusA-like endonuclease